MHKEVESIEGQISLLMATSAGYDVDSTKIHCRSLNQAGGNDYFQ